jgi:uncharacterized protein YggE
MYTTGMLRAQVADAAPTPISPGEQQLQVTVIARWQFVGVR